MGSERNDKEMIVTQVSAGGFGDNVTAKMLLDYLEEKSGLVWRCRLKTSSTPPDTYPEFDANLENIKKVKGYEKVEPHAFVHFVDPDSVNSAVEDSEKGKLIINKNVLEVSLGPENPYRMNQRTTLTTPYICFRPPTTTTFTAIRPPLTTKPKKVRYSTPKMSTNNTPTQLITSMTKLIWGKSLPPQLLISTVRTTWSTIWQIMMSQLAPSDPSGSYTRPVSQFQKPNPTQLTNTSLHLYAALPCPWAHRTLIVRALKGLEHSIPVSIASPGLDGSWVFNDIQSQGNNKFTNDEVIPSRGKLTPTRDKVNGAKTVREVYKMRKGGYDGRCTVPMLWDVEKKQVVCNESYDIIELFNSGFNGLAKNPDLDLDPAELKEQIEEWNRIIYPNINNGVYRCGFAQSQEAYDTAVNELFNALDTVDDHLKNSRYLCGDKLTLADVCLFTTLIRFDLVYNVMFKCTKKKVVEYPSLYGYMRDIYQIPKVAETCNLEAMMDGYYKFLFPLNPGNISPVMPIGSNHEHLLQSHNRESLSTSQQSVKVRVS